MLQMVTRVQLDTRHVSRCVTVRREKMHRYIRNPNELLRYARFRILLLRLRELEYAEREFRTVPEVLSFLLVFWWFSRWLGRRSVIGRSGAVLSFAGSWGESRRRTEADTVQSRSRFDEARLLRPDQQAGSWTIQIIKGTFFFPYEDFLMRLPNEELFLKDELPELFVGTR